MAGAVALQVIRGGHEYVKHSMGEYVRPGTDIHLELYPGRVLAAQARRDGNFHSVSKKHLPNYFNEFEFRWNTRKQDDGERLVAAIRASNGKPLDYPESVDNPPYLVVPAE